jgi:BirA family biotin operon repressor/biotin-[acetyl-CoA-carboxylase] ligase
MPPPQFDLQRIFERTTISQAEHHPSVASTNDRAKRRALDVGCRLPLLVLADEQTAGRGRGSNRWWSSEGCLMFSVAWTSATGAGEPGRSGLVAVASAVAVVEALRALAPNVEIGLHWPNDVFAAGKKLVGILVEVLPNQRPVIGIGVNVNNRLDDAPPELRRRAVSLRELTGRRYDLTDLLIDILQRLDVVMGQLGAVPAEMIAQANARCLQRGKTLVVETAGREITGRCTGIGPGGELLLDTPEGPVQIVSGVVRKPESE